MTTAKERTTADGMRWGLLELHAHGVMPPVDEAHADRFDPPLSLAECRHRLHDRHGLEVGGCRFCARKPE